MMNEQLPSLIYLQQLLFLHALARFYISWDGWFTPWGV